MTTRDISNMEDVLDVRDIIARVETLETERDEFEHDEDGNHTEADWPQAEPLDAAELKTLQELLSDLQGNGGDEQWRGDWYPITLIRDSHFRDYAEELASDIGAINSDATWPNNCIDWERAARELQQDYSTVEFDGITYWYR